MLEFDSAFFFITYREHNGIYGNRTVFVFGISRVIFILYAVLRNLSLVEQQVNKTRNGKSVAGREVDPRVRESHITVSVNALVLNRH